MGREIRRVPANWQHPKGQMPYGYDYLPMHDQNYEDALAEWNEEHEQWIAGTHPDLVSGATTKEENDFEEWHGEAPDPRYYRPYKDEEGTWFQAYQTVSEGTPVTPAFATLQELEDWLVEKGECYGTKYNEKFSRQAAHNFCMAQWAPSFILDTATGTMAKGIQSCE